jgi:hypothetical protein
MLNAAEIADSILACHTTVDALKYLRQPAGAAEVVLLDVNMPEMNGFEFLDVYANLSSARRGRDAYLIGRSVRPCTCGGVSMCRRLSHQTHRRDLCASLAQLA